MSIVSANEENSNNADLKEDSVTINKVNTKNSVEGYVLIDSEIQKENMANSISLNNNENTVKSVAAENWAKAKQAIKDAANGDTVYLNGTTYISTNGDTITVSKNITIHGGSETNQSLVSTLDMNKLKRIILINSNCVISIVNVNFLNGSSNNGGAIYGDDNVILTITNCSFTDNYGGYYDSGGAIYLGKYCNLSVNNSKFTNNRARYGGVIYGDDNVILTITNCSFTDNHATYSGGVIYGDDNVILTITNCSFTDNYGGWIGGGVIYLGEYCNLSVDYSKFTENNGQYGGAIRVCEYCNLSVNNSEFTNNSNDYGVYGGAICVGNNVTLTITNCNFTDNLIKKGSHHGGAIDGKNNVILNITNCNFTNNNGLGHGGAIYLVKNCNLSIYNSKFTENYGYWGGAIYMSDNASLVVFNSEFTNNTSTNPGGTIYLRNSILAYIESSKFYIPRVSAAGTLYCGGSNKNVTVSNCEFINSDKYPHGQVIVIAGNSNCSIFNSKFNITSKPNDYNYNYIIDVRGRSILDLSNNIITIDGVHGIPIRVSKNTDVISKTQETWSNNFTTVYNCSTKILLWLVDDNNNLIEVDGGINVTIGSTGIKMEFDKYYGRYFGEYTPDFVGVELIRCNIFSNVTDTVYVIVKLIPEMDINTVVNGFDVDVTVTMNTTGTVEFIVNGTSKANVTLIDGKAVLNIIDSDAGEFIVEAIFKGNDRYTKSKVNDTFNVYKLASNMNITAVPGIFNATIIVNLNTDGMVNLNIDNRNFTVEVKNGVGSIFVPDLKPATYTVNGVFEGNRHYNGTTASNVFEIEGINLIITADPVIEFFGDNKSLFIKATNSLGNPVEGIFIEFEINGINYNRTTDSRGLAIKPIDLPVGFYKFNVCFNGDSNYAPITVSSNITIKTTIVSQNIVKIFGNDTPFSATFLDSEGNPAKNSSVSFNMIGIFYYEITDIFGNVYLNIDFTPGTYIITASNSVTGELRSFNITFLPNMITHDVVKYFKNGTQYEITLLDEHGNAAPIGSKVVFNIDGVFYERTTTNTSAKVKLNINLLPDTYILTATYNGLSISNNVTVLSTIQSEDLDISTKDRRPFVATLLDDQGLPAKSAKATFNIHGISYHRVSDANGMIKLNINLQSGEYIITTYYGDLAKSNKVTVNG